MQNGDMPRKNCMKILLAVPQFGRGEDKIIVRGDIHKIIDAPPYILW